MQHRVYTLSEGRPEFDNVRYIGITSVGRDKRWRAHICGQGVNTHLKRWIAKCKRKRIPIVCEYLEEHDTREELNSAEVYWIAKYREWGYRLINLTSGGEGTCNPSDETRAKMSAASKGRGKGRIVSRETRAKLSSAKTGKKIGPPTPETCLKISVAKTGKKLGPRSPKTLAKTRAKVSAARAPKPKPKPERCGGIPNPEAFAKWLEKQDKRDAKNRRYKMQRIKTV